MNLETYLKAEKIVKDKEIKDAINLMPKILSLCIKKKLDFSYCESAAVIDVRNLKTGFCLTGYLSEQLINYESENCQSIKNIYKKLKEY